METGKALLVLGCGGIIINVLIAPLLSIIRRLYQVKTPMRTDNTINTISVIMPVYNEEESLSRKLDNLLVACEAVPGVSLEVIIGSDGSTDGTVSLAERWIGRHSLEKWRIQEFRNEGKCQTINKMLLASTGEIVISTDADVLMPRDAIRKIVDAFRKDENLGCVSCVPVLYGGQMGAQVHYWNVESSIRKAESEAGLLIVVTGWLYAYRRIVYREIPQGVMADDLWIPLAVLLRGYRSIQLAEVAVLSETTDEATEVRRRRRVIAGGMDVIRRMWGDLMRKPALLLLVTAHKINRWALPLWLTLVVLGTVSDEPRLIGPYLLVLLGLRFGMGQERFRNAIASVLAPLGAVAEVARTRDLAKWQHTRRR